MDDFSISVGVEDVSGSIFLSWAIAEFDDVEIGNVSISGDRVLFVIADKQYSISITKVLNAIYNHTKK